MSLTKEQFFEKNKHLSKVEIFDKWMLSENVIKDISDEEAWEFFEDVYNKMKGTPAFKKFLQEATEAKSPFKKWEYWDKE